MNDGYKSRAICPRCGEINYKPPTYYKTKVLDKYGIEHYAMFSKVKYKCRTCKCVWSEIWDEGRG